MNRLALMVLRNLHLFPGAYWKLCRYAKHTDEYDEQEKFAHIRYMMSRAVQAGNIDLQVYGKENLPRENGYVMYGNHQGLFDVIAIAATFDGAVGAVFKKELQGIPIVDQVIACTKSFAMDREDVRQSMKVIQAVTEEVKKGRNYVIFPEGTRSKKGNEMLPFHSGSFRSALKAQCPIVPFAFIDSFKVLDQKGSAPVTVQLHYLPAIPYEEYQGMKTGEIAAMVQERIAQVIAAHSGATE